MKRFSSVADSLRRLPAKTIMTLTFPGVNMNGSKASVLLEENREAAHALRQAIEALSSCDAGRSDGLRLRLVYNPVSNRGLGRVLSSRG